MIRIAICDDDNAYVDELKNLLEKCLPENFNYSFQVFNSGEDLLSLSDYDIPIDILFMDVKLKGLNGIETVRIFKRQQPHCIVFFVTYHNSFIPEMFRLDAFQFLQKPINVRDFKIDLKRALELYVRRHKHLEIKSNGNLSKILISDIVYISVQNKQIKIKTLKDTFYHSGSITDYDTKLKGFNFVHSHKSYLINLKFVEQIEAKELKLKGENEIIPISRNFRSEFIKQYNIYNFGTNL